MSCPNVVLIVLDTARAATLQTDASPMPMLEELAKDGVEFTCAMANSPWTLPSHGTLFTGQYPSVHGAHALHKSFSADRTLAAQLSDGGYRTVGISNNTWISREFGFAQGFDEFYATWQLFQDAVDFGDIAQTETGTFDRLRGVARKFRGNPVKNVANLIYGQFFRRRYDDGAERTNQIIERNAADWLGSDCPLFLFVNYLEPHLEYRPPDEFAREWLPDGVSLAEAKQVEQDAWAYITGETSLTEREFDILRGLYRAELAYLDGKLAELVDLFAKTDRETVFIVSGDHGENIGDHGLMDHQYCLFETLLHVPLVIAGDGFSHDDPVMTPVQLADLFPTLLDLTGISYDSSEFPGKSLCSPDELPYDRPLFAEYLGPQPPIETLEGRYECTRDVSEFDRRLRAVRRGDWKFIRGSDGTEWLFDLETDDNEARNLVSDHPDRRDDLAATLDKWTATLPAVTGSEVEMDPATKARLEDLGYLQ